MDRLVIFPTTGAIALALSLGPAAGWSPYDLFTQLPAMSLLRARARFALLVMHGAGERVEGGRAAGRSQSKHHVARSLRRRHPVQCLCMKGGPAEAGYYGRSRRLSAPRTIGTIQCYALFRRRRDRRTIRDHIPRVLTRAAIVPQDDVATLDHVLESHEADSAAVGTSSAGRHSMKSGGISS